MHADNWKKFRKMWPIERLSSLTIKEYLDFVAHVIAFFTTLGYLPYAKQESFGLFVRPKTGIKRILWRRAINAKTADAAFVQVKAELLLLVQIVQAGQLERLAPHCLAPLAAWQIAFLYQDPRNIVMLPIVSKAKLLSLLGEPASSQLSQAKCYQRLLRAKGDQDIFTYTQALLEQRSHVTEAQEAQGVLEQSPIPLNQILYGPPGTGKTYATVDKAIEIFVQAGLQLTDESRQAKCAAFEKLMQSGHIVFVTFHPNFSYEAFVEGIQAIPDAEGHLRYQVTDGLFKKLCLRARTRVHIRAPFHVTLASRQLWKVQLPAALYAECLQANYLFAPVGSQPQVFYRQLPTPPSQEERLAMMLKEMAEGDILFVCEGADKILAVGIVGAYRLLKRQGKDSDESVEGRTIDWLYDFTPSYPACEEVISSSEGKIVLATLEQKERVQAFLQGQDFAFPYVLIIDEINRGHVATIFGELITLLEESHRERVDAHSPQRETLQVCLPYSQSWFTIPDNVYVLATMNTADRSLTRFDVALRRRFHFVSMPARPELLANVFLDHEQTLSLATILSVLNKRLHLLLDQDHCLGHALFMPLTQSFSMHKLAAIFKDSLAPLLEEYFWQDWSKIQLLLNDHRKEPGKRFLVQTERESERLWPGDTSFETMSLANKSCWHWNEAAFSDIEAWRQILP